MANEMQLSYEKTLFDICDYLVGDLGTFAASSAFIIAAFQMVNE